MFFPFKGEEWLTSSMKLQQCVASTCTGVPAHQWKCSKVSWTQKLSPFQDNMSTWAHMFCARCIRPPGFRCGVGRDDPGSGQSDCWQTSAKSKSRSPGTSCSIWSYLDRHLDPLDSNRCRTTYEHIWTHSVQDAFACLVSLPVLCLMLCGWEVDTWELLQAKAFTWTNLSNFFERFKTFSRQTGSIFARLKQVLWLWPRNMDRSAVHIRWVVCARGHEQMPSLYDHKNHKENYDIIHIRISWAIRIHMNSHRHHPSSVIQGNFRSYIDETNRNKFWTKHSGITFPIPHSPTLTKNI